MMFGMKKVGEVKFKKSNEIKSSRIGLGMEKLDRNLYDPAPCYDEMANTGVKWVRLQSGWCRTESRKGEYDFAWLDEIVENLIRRGMTPWMCLCYGNELYTEGACNAYGSVGRPPIKTEAERAAWDRYVKATVARYKGKVEYYEVWNEPDGEWCWRGGVNAKEYSDFVIRTAKAIKEADGNAKVIAGSFHSGLKFLNDFLSAGCAEYVDYVTYHRYKYIPDNGTEKYVKGAQAVIALYNPKIGLIQGETGTHSEYSPNGALPCANWTERKQAKFLLRKLTIDLATDVMFTSYFTAVDIYENIFTDSGEKTKSSYGFFGILGEEFDGEKPLGKYREKQSYKAFQTLCSVFSEEYKRVELPIQFDSSYSSYIGREDDRAQDDFGGVYAFGFERPNGAKALAYWKGNEILSTDYESTISFHAYGLHGKVRLIDLYDGSVYEISDKILRSQEKELYFEHLPVKDYPMLITFGEFAETKED